MEIHRKNHLLAIIAGAAKALKKWVEHGDSTIVPEDDVYRRFQEIADQATQMDHARAEPLEQLFLEFAPHWFGFAQQLANNVKDSGENLFLPSEDFWPAWDALANFELEAKLPKFKLIETIAELKEQKVNDRQICQIYGFLDEDGIPSLQMLKEEVAEPGKHTGPGWVAPVNRGLIAASEQMKAEQVTLARRRNGKLSAVASVATPAPESIEQLVAGGIAATQISRMKRMTVQQVYQYCDEYGLPRPPFDYTSVMQQSVPPRHPSAEGPFEHPSATPRQPLADETYDYNTLSQQEGDDDMPVGIDLSTLPPEEANQVQEAYGYFSQGMDLGTIAASMGIHGNKVRSLLTKAGVDLSRPAVAAT